MYLRILDIFPGFDGFLSYFFIYFVNFNVCHIISCKILKIFGASRHLKRFFYTRACKNGKFF